MKWYLNMCRQLNSRCSSVVPRNTLRTLNKVVKVMLHGCSKTKYCALISKVRCLGSLKSVCAKLCKSASWINFLATILYCCSKRLNRLLVPLRIFYIWIMLMVELHLRGSINEVNST